VVVLHEDGVEPALAVLLAVVGLEEEAAVVAVDVRLYEQDAGDRRLAEPHRAGSPSRSRR